MISHEYAYPHNHATVHSSCLFRLLSGRFEKSCRFSRLSRNYAEKSVINMVTMVTSDLPLFLLPHDFLVVARLLALLQYQYTSCVISTDLTYRDSSLND